MNVEESKAADFVVRLVGSDVKPWSVPMRTLARLMDAVQRLVEQSEEEDADPIPSPDDSDDQQPVSLGSNVLKLVGIRASSAGYAIATPFRDGALAILTATGNAIEDPGRAEWSAATISSLKDISEIAKSLGVKVEIRKPNTKGRLGDVVARITPLTYDEVADSAFVRGQTTLFGTVERIGGASAARCAIRVPEQPKLVYCNVSGDELAKRIGQYLYQDISIHGEATWLRATWRITSFDIISFDPPKTGSFSDALKDIWKAGGKAWDSVEDPDAFIAEMRGT